MRLADGNPGEHYLFVDEHGRWAIWKLLDGEHLERARNLGYTRGPVAVCVLVGRPGESPFRAGEEFGPGDYDDLYAVCHAAETFPDADPRWTPLGAL